MKPRRWLSALGLFVLAGAAAAVAGGAVAAATWVGAEAGEALKRARLDQPVGWARSAELVGVLALGSVVGLGWRAALRREARR